MQHEVNWLTFYEGHANFLDVLVDNLDDDPAEEETLSPIVSPQESNTSEETDPATVSSDEEHVSEDSWTDDSDDEHHALSRTASNHSLVDMVKAKRNDTRAAIADSEGDYFSFSRHDESHVEAKEVSLDGIDKHDGISVSVVADLMDQMGVDKSPLDLPHMETTINGAGAGQVVVEG